MPRKANANANATTARSHGRKNATPPAQPEPPQPAPRPEYELRVEQEQIFFTRADRTYRVRGLEKNMSTMQLNVNLLASRLDLAHADSVDLLKARARQSFVRAAASELFTDEDQIKKDVGLLLLQLEELQRDQIERAKRPRAVAPEMTDRERDEALALLRDPRLLERIVEDLTTCGMIGERTNKLVGYLAAVSRKLAEPLAILVQSLSSAGKSTLMENVLSLMPSEEVLRCSGITAQSLYYLGSHDIAHKILAISEEAGVGEAAYALKLLQSEGELRHLTVGKNEAGRMQAQEYHVQGPVQLVMTTTSLEMDEELVNRCLVLAVDEGREQTSAIHERQRWAQMPAATRSQHTATHIRQTHAHAQRLLRPLTVYNPYATQLTFPSNKTRLRRDHKKYLTLIEAVTLLHQYQREIHTEEVAGHTVEYIEATPYDIEIATTLCGEVLGRSLDELAPQTRRCLELLHAFVVARCRDLSVAQRDLRFTRSEFRAAIGWSDFQVKKHLARLVDLEYVLVHYGKRGKQFVYELLYDGQGQTGEAFLMGLMDVAAIRALTPCPRGKTAPTTRT